MTIKDKAKMKAVKAISVQRIKEQGDAYEKSIQNIPKTDPWVNITLGDTDFKLEFSFKAVRDLFRSTGKNLNAGELRIDELKDPELLIKVLLAGLSVHNADLTEEDLVGRLTMRHRTYYAHVISKALEASQPDYLLLESVLGDLEELNNSLSGDDELEAGDTSAPLPVILPSPISGDGVDS